jgi:hypothetical protein
MAGRSDSSTRAARQARDSRGMAGTPRGRAAPRPTLNVSRREIFGSRVWGRDHRHFTRLFYLLWTITSRMIAFARPRLSLPGIMA